jgi:outer membrane protein OmpA-like peptidoglycan-associated protein
VSPAVLRAVLGSCLTLGVADLAWLDLNAERMTSSASPAPTAPIQPLTPAAPIERLPPIPPPSSRSDEVLAPVMTTESHPSPPQPERCVVHFDLGASVISDDQAKMLTPIADALRKNPKAVVRVDGHADRTGWKRNGNNLALSDERAAAIVRALDELGVPRDRIRTAAFGDTRPVDDRPTEEALRRNRRAEVRIELTGDR